MEMNFPFWISTHNQARTAVRLIFGKHPARGQGKAAQFYPITIYSPPPHMPRISELRIPPYLGWQDPWIGVVGFMGPLYGLSGPKSSPHISAVEKRVLE